MKKQIITALAKWVVRTAEKKRATPEELAALADVAKIVMDYSVYLASGEVR